MQLRSDAADVASYCEVVWELPRLVIGAERAKGPGQAEQGRWALVPGASFPSGT